jgi:hypothetical protein
MRKIDKSTGEIFNIKPGGMYAPFPIPAYQVLVRLREHQAARIMTCLVSHLGSKGREVFPSYSTISHEAGVSRNSIKKSLDLLVELGFIKVGTWREGRKDRNSYYIQEAAYNSGIMNKFARSYRDCEGACRRCGAKLDRGGFKLVGANHIHIGCGGSVKVRGIESRNPYKNIVLLPRDGGKDGLGS